MSTVYLNSCTVRTINIVFFLFFFKEVKKRQQKKMEKIYDDEVENKTKVK